MPMTTQSVPHLKEPIVAEAPKKTEVKAEAPKEAPKLAPAGASGDAGVQNLLAQRSGHASNGDTDKVADIDRQLAALGFTAQ